MIISLFSFLFLKHRVYSNCDVKSSRSSHVFRRHVSWLSWNPHLNSRSVVIVWSREGFLISLIQLFPSPRLQGHSIFNALPFHSPLSTLHSRFRFLFSFLENILTLWPNQRLRPWEPFSHCRPENFSRSLTMSARRPDIARTPRSCFRNRGGIWTIRDVWHLLIVYWIDNSCWLIRDNWNWSMYKIVVYSMKYK